ncbi:hypothetical protein PSI15_14490 [Xenorhabdus sp. PR6a]|uniref:hypothetical protein n=1 Tax=Xenorhabdus sp. PR6a TaxID=3025877 RepID=UPI00235819C2|nr:hypothetical protein [Xenorhabdus sp. PR6a]MDC9582758.1 hypothetical protein [Xenorhabdus sp. PR6a]
MKNKLLLAMLLPIIVSGCSSNRLNASASKEVPVERMYWEKGRDNTSGDSTIIIKRDAGVVYSACVSNIFFQGVRIAELMPSEKVTLNVNSGEYILGEFLSGSGCFSFAKTLIANIKPNSVNVFRVKTIFLGANGGDSLIRDTDISTEIKNSVFE